MRRRYILHNIKNEGIIKKSGRVVDGTIIRGRLMSRSRG